MAVAPHDPSGTRLLQRPDGEVAYDVDGAGPLVVLVPGMGELRSSYRFVAPMLVAAGFRVVTVDLRGHGDSGTSFTSYGDAATAGDLEALLGEFGVPAVIVGNSLAAGAAVLVAATHPDLVDALVLVGPFVRNPPLTAVEAHAFEVLTAAEGIADRWRDLMPLLYAGRKPDDFPDYIDAVHRSLLQPRYGAALSLTARGADHAAAEAALEELTLPVLVLMGTQDPDFADPQHEAAWIAQITAGEAVMIADAGHYPHAQQPTLTAEAIASFLQEHLGHA